MVASGSISMNTVLSDGSGGAPRCSWVLSSLAHLPHTRESHVVGSAGGAHLTGSGFKLNDLSLDGNSAFYGGALYVAADMASNATLNGLQFGPNNSAIRGAQCQRVSVSECSVAPSLTAAYRR